MVEEVKKQPETEETEIKVEKAEAKNEPKPSRKAKKQVNKKFAKFMKGK